MKEKFIKLYMTIAQTVAGMSHAKRLNVGAIIVKDDRVISMGYNGMPAGWDNNCEDREYMDQDAGGWLNPDDIEALWPYVDWSDEDQAFTKRYRLKTKPEVLHAESNAIAKLARSTESGEGADIFITHSPCIDCAKLIYQSGIRRVWFGKSYRDNTGIDFLEKSGVEVRQIDT